MRIAIITYHAAHNYGAMLQAFALQHELESMSHDVVHLHMRPYFTNTSKYDRKSVRSVKDLVVKIAFMALKKRFLKRFENFEEFLHSEIHLTRKYMTNDELESDPPDVDAFVYGSDQIWNLQSGIEHRFYGAYVPESAPRIAYAPSFGNCSIPGELAEEVKALLMRFRHLAVREKSGCELVANLTGREVAETVDPIFFVGNEVWDGLARKPDFSGPYLVLYTLESSKRVSAIVGILADKLRVPIVVLGKAGSFMATHKTIFSIESGPREFLGWIRGAKLVVTNSFHATAFATKFHVPFITIAHSHRNARMEDLLSSMGLSERIVHQASDLQDKTKEWLLDLAWDGAEASISRQTERSREYLRSSIASVSEG